MLLPFILPLTVATASYAQKSLSDSSVARIKQTQQKLQQQTINKANQVTNGFFRTDLTKVHRELFLGAKAYSDGWSGQLGYGKQADSKLTHLFMLEVGEKKHDKEEKFRPSGLAYEDYGKQRPYILGKTNYFYAVNLSYGQSRIVFPGLISPGMNIALQYQGGVSIGLLKPCYLNMKYYNGADLYVQSETYNTANTETFINRNFIYGADKWSKGLNEMQVMPGLFLAAAGELEFGKSIVWLKALQAGASATIYTKKISILAEQKAYPYFVNLFVGVRLGKRW